MTSTVLSWWDLGAVAYSKTLKKARGDNGTVLGQDRMPTFDDFDYLRYIRAMAKQVLR